MANRLILDAMIKRGDFWQQNRDGDDEQIASARPASSITFENLKNDSNFVLSLRKPDFQRETNQWTVSQAVNFIQSFIDGDLVPSVILWQSKEGFIFVIDGAHRLSALRAWIEDDYGDREASIAFFNGEIPSEQKKSAHLMRTRVEKAVGSYKSLKDKLAARSANGAIEYDAVTNRRLKNIGTRQLELQWVTGDADIAEKSFFKINTQGTPLDKTEESLLRNRDRAAAIAARSIVRAATGHKYWSKFSDDVKKKIEDLSLDVNRLIFQPELKSPIKTMGLPIGGSASNLEALSMLIRLLSITDSDHENKRPSINISPRDEDGECTVSTLKECFKVLQRISGNDACSLGLHPVVYFYSDRGKYVPDLFLGMCYVIKMKLLNNDNEFFKKFTVKREKIELFMFENKAIFSAMLVQISSRLRIERVSDIINYMVYSEDEGITIEGIAAAAKLKGSIVDLRQKIEGKDFSDEVKSTIYLKSALHSSLRCPICKGYIEPSLSASFDHIERKEDGGRGGVENGQICHPYCNTGFKN